MILGAHVAGMGGMEGWVNKATGNGPPLRALRCCPFPTFGHIHRYPMLPILRYGPRTITIGHFIFKRVACGPRQEERGPDTPPRGGQFPISPHPMAMLPSSPRPAVECLRVSIQPSVVPLGLPLPRQATISFVISFAELQSPIDRRRRIASMLLLYRTQQ